MKERLLKIVLWLKKFFKKDTRILLLQIYIIVLLVGFILTLLFAAFPSLIVCNNIFGEEFCTPTGLYLGLLASLPGYVIAGNLLASFNQLPTALSFIIVISTSGIFYFLLGFLIDKARKKKFTKELLIILSSFIILIISVILLLVRLM
jgi:hypothetical protein